MASQAASCTCVGSSRSCTGRRPLLGSISLGKDQPFRLIEDAWAQYACYREIRHCLPEDTSVALVFVCVRTFYSNHSGRMAMAKFRPSAFMMLLARLSGVFGSRYAVTANSHLPIDPSWMPIDLSQTAPLDTHE